MKFKGTIIGEASGSVASLTFSHNRGGQYIRQRAVPVNPSTSFQTEVRNFMAQLSAAWVGTLTPAQRSAWEVYAVNTPLPDTLGEPRNPGGVAMYNRTNVPRLQAGLPRVDDAPTVFNLGTLTVPSVAVTASTDVVDVTFTPADAWANEVGGALMVLASRPQNPTINYFTGPYRFTGAILGAATPPTSPAQLALPFPVGLGNRVFFQFRATRADGRVTSPFRVATLAA